MNCGERDLVGDLRFSQEGAPRTHQSLLEISSSIGIWRSSVRWIIHLSRATQPEENNVPVWLLCSPLMLQN